MGKSKSAEAKGGMFDGELYDRRMRVYLAAHEVIEQTIRDGRVHTSSMAHFEKEKMQAEFLFSEKITDYLDEFHQMAGKNLASNTVLTHVDEAEQIVKLTKDSDKSLEWIIKQKERLREVFAKDMRVC